MNFLGKDTYGYRLAQILRKLNQGEKLDPKALAAEFDVTLRAIQRDLNERLAFLHLEKVNGRYLMPSPTLGKLTLRDVERFAGVSGVRGLFPSLSDDYLLKLIDTRLESVLLVKGPHYEELSSSQQILFGQLEDAIRAHQLIAYTYEKADGLKSYQQIEPYKLVNHDGTWYLAAKDGGRLKAFSLVKLNRLQITATTFTPDPSVHVMLNDEDGIWLNKSKLEVVLKITGAAASFFRRRKLVPNQVIEKELENGEIIVSAKVAHANQILPTVRQWIPCIRIIRPEGLQAAMEAEIRSYLDM